MGVILRPYQKRAVSELRHSYASGRRAPLLCLPTGGGKTIVFSEVTHGARAKGKRVLVVAHRRELIRQASEKLTSAGVYHGVICPGFDASPDELVQVGSIQTLGRRLDKLPSFDLIVFDECHHVAAGSWRKLTEAQPDAKLLGVTATPIRLDGKGLGVTAGGVFDDLIVGTSVSGLVQQGFLSPARCFVPENKLDLRGVRTLAGDYVASDLEGAVSKPSITGDAIAQYRARADHKPSIAFCISVKHAMEVAASFREAGYRAVAASGETPTTERDAAISGLRTGSTEVLATCDLISEGLDVPAVGAVILLRPTKSLGLYLQQVGRGMRPAPGKEFLIVNDHVGNCFEHGLPEADRQWSLDGVKKKTAGGVWLCLRRDGPDLRGCLCLNSNENRVCSACGAPKPQAPATDYGITKDKGERRSIETVDGELAEMSVSSARQREAELKALSYREVVGQRRSLAELAEIAKARGYQRGWAFRQFKDQFQRMGAAR